MPQYCNAMNCQRSKWQHQRQIVVQSSSACEVMGINLEWIGQARVPKEVEYIDTLGDFMIPVSSCNR